MSFFFLSDFAKNTQLFPRFARNGDAKKHLYINSTNQGLYPQSSKFLVSANKIWFSVVACSVGRDLN
jgi:hypothetical protein